MDKTSEYNAYISSSAWKKLCAVKKKQADNMCQCCNCGSARLSVHHLTYERFKKERLDDLIVVCKDCHEKLDKKRKEEVQKNNARILEDARFKGWMDKVYGENRHHGLEDDENVQRRYEEFCERKEREDI